MFEKLWLDEHGAVLTIELILLMVIVVIGSVVGLTILRDAINAKLAHVAAAIAALDTGFSFSGVQYTPEVPTTGNAGTASANGSTSATSVSPDSFAPAVVLQSVPPEATDSPLL